MEDFDEALYCNVNVTVGLASHWLCITDSVVSTYGLNGLGKGDEHSTQTPFGVLRHLYLYLLPVPYSIFFFLDDTAASPTTHTCS